MIKIKCKKNPYRKSDISSEDAYKLGEILELIFQLEFKSKDKDSFYRAGNIELYMSKLNSNFSSVSKIYFNKGRKVAEKEAKELFNILDVKQLKKYQDSLIDEVEELKYKNNI